MAIEKVETVSCELSATFQPGDKRCLSFFRSNTNQVCRECDLSGKIDKLIHPVFKTVDPNFMSKLDREFPGHENTSTEEVAIDTDELEEKKDSPNSHVFKLKGNYFLEWFEMLSCRPKGQTHGLEIMVRGCMKGFREAGAIRGTLKWLAYDPRYLTQVNPIQYYEIGVKHLNANVVRALVDSMSTNCRRQRQKR